MSTHMISDTVTARDGVPPRRYVIGWGIAAGVHTVLVFTQAALAGQMLSGAVSARSAHGFIGEDLLPYVALMLLLITVLVWRPGRGPVWPALTSLLLLVADVFQLSFGFAGQLEAHVPLGVAIFGLSLTLLAGARRAARTGRAQERQAASGNPTGG